MRVISHAALLDWGEAGGVGEAGPAVVRVTVVASRRANTSELALYARCSMRPASPVMLLQLATSYLLGDGESDPLHGGGFSKLELTMLVVVRRRGAPGAGRNDLREPELVVDRRACRPRAGSYRPRCW